jgi:hypothetical protein
MSSIESGANANRHPANVQREDSQGIRRRHLSRKDLIEYSLVSLGFPVVEVEVQENVFDVFEDRTLDEYNRWMAPYKYEVLTNVSSTINKYDLETLNKPFGRGVVDVQILSKENFFSPISGVFALGIPHPISHLSPDQYDLALRYIKMARQVYSSAPDWLWEEPCLWLYSPTGYGGPFQASYCYTADCSKWEDIPQRDHGWCKDYFAASVKKTVGETRGKFQGLPGPFQQALRGENMVKEATEALDALTMSMQQRSYARVPPYGLTGGF